MKITTLLIKRYLLGILFTILLVASVSLALFTLPLDGLHAILVKAMKKLQNINCKLK